MEMSGQRHVPVLYPRGKSVQYSFDRRLFAKRDYENYDSTTGGEDPG